MTSVRRQSALHATAAMLALVSRAVAQQPETTTAPVPVSPSVEPATAQHVAESDGCAGERFVVVTFASDIDAAFAAEVRTDLATELSQRGITLCSADATPREPAASIAVRIEDTTVFIALDDRLTQKRVARDLTLAHLPRNGRALATAIAIDELLRASWAELTLRRDDRPPPASTPPEQPPRAPPLIAIPSGRPPPPPSTKKHRLLLGGDVGYSHTAYAFDAFSFDARATYRPHFGWFVLQLGPLRGLRVDTERGELVTRGVFSAVTAGACAQGAPRVFGCAGARAGISFLAFRGSDARMAEARDREATVVSVSAVTMVGGKLSERFTLFGELGAGSVVKGARATDGTQRLVSVTGLLLTLHAGLEVEL
jgi:hypothetical protein